MEIVRNDLWNQCLKDAMKMYRIDEANEKCESLADATWKMKMSYKNHEKKKDSRQIIILDKAPTVVNDATRLNIVKLRQWRENLVLSGLSVGVSVKNTELIRVVVLVEKLK
jgi:hypothetical protein